ncbi:MAG: glycosyltransferase family 2 protein [Flavobacterium sp.]|nr:MAG: glycosyltransferase family 2 protein [Flavobacterium sp.]
MSTLAPIALFLYNRPEHTKRTLEALAQCHLAKESILYIFCDGPKEPTNSEGINKIFETRAVAQSEKWCKEVVLKENDKNKGLANSIIDGVTEVVNKHGKIIVLEDDIIVSPYFLKYMNDGLDVYENEDAVICIHAYNYPIPAGGIPDTFFMRGADCQGWATWRRGWDLFEKDAVKLYNEILNNGLEYDFNFKNSYPYSHMLKAQIDGHVDSWAIRWYASAFLAKKFTLYPNVSMIYNIGFDNSGTHSGEVDNFNNKGWNNKYQVVVKYAKPSRSNKIALKRWMYHFHKNNGNEPKRSFIYNNFTIKIIYLQF